MIRLGYLLVIGAFLVGALLCSLDPETLPWPWFLLTLTVGALGLYLIKSHEKQHATDESRLSENITVLQQSLDNLVSNLSALVDSKPALPPYDYRFEIDRLFRDDLDNFAEARHAIAHSFSLQHYAEVMSPFAAGERYINRVWSASMDGYIDEVNHYLGRALEQFQEAQRQLGVE